jgi:TetR/AcrR family transcriptional repressor of nem operon
VLGAVSFFLLMSRVSDARERLLQATNELIWESSYGSTSVDAICQRAGVNKGSFYHFFASKADLAVAAIDTEWQQRRSVLNEFFSPLVPPLERFRRLHGYCLAEQERLLEEKGFVVGCPLFSLGCEVCTQNEPIRQKIEEILGQHLMFIESAIRDAHSQKLVRAPDATAKARILLGYIEGQLTRARIQNDLAPIREIEAGTLDILGLSNAVAGRP